MASFSSTLPFPASPKQYEVTPDHPKAFTHRQRSYISQTFQTFALFQKYLQWRQEARESNLGPNTCATSTRHQWPGFFVQRLEGSKARTGQCTSSVQRFFSLLAAGNAPLLAFQNHRAFCHRGQPCLGKLISLPLPPLPSVLGQQPTSFSHPPLTQPRTEANALD